MLLMTKAATLQSLERESCVIDADRIPMLQPNPYALTQASFHLHVSHPRFCRIQTLNNTRTTHPNRTLNIAAVPKIASIINLSIMKSVLV